MLAPVAGPNPPVWVDHPWLENTQCQWWHQRIDVQAENSEKKPLCLAGDMVRMVNRDNDSREDLNLEATFVGLCRNWINWGHNSTCAKLRNKHQDKGKSFHESCSDHQLLLMTSGDNCLCQNPPGTTKPESDNDAMNVLPSKWNNSYLSVQTKLPAIINAAPTTFLREFHGSAEWLLCG